MSEFDKYGAVSLEQLAKVEREYRPSHIPAPTGEAPSKPTKQALRPVNLQEYLAQADSAFAATNERIQLAKPFVVRKDDPATRGGAFVVRKSPAGGVEKSGTPEAQLLAEADQQLQAGEVADAFAGYLNILKEYPGTEAAALAEQSLEELAQYAEEGQWSPEDVQALTPQLPYLEDLSNLKSKYWMARGFYIAGIAGENEQGISTSDYFAESRDVAHAVMLEYPDAPEQLDVVELYFASGRTAGYAQLLDVCSEAKAFLREHETTVAGWVTRAHLAQSLHHDQNDIGASGIEHGNVIGTYESSGVQALLGGTTATSDQEAAFKSLLAGAYAATGYVDEADQRFSEVLQFHPQSGKIAHDAAYVRAFLRFYYNQEDLEAGLVAFEEALSLYPESANVPMILWNMAGIYVRSEQFDEALSTYQELLSRYPESAQALHTERVLGYLEEIGSITEGERETVLAQAETTQTLRSSCGPVALQGLLALSGVQTNIERLAAASGANSNGSSMLGLVNAASTAGVALQGIRATSIDALRPPVIAHVNGNHFALLTEIAQDTITLRDGHRETYFGKADFLEAWDGSYLAVNAAVNDQCRLMTEEELGALVGAIDGTHNCDENNCSHDSCNFPPGGPGDGGLGRLGSIGSALNSNLRTAGLSPFPGISLPSATVGPYQSSVTIRETDIQVTLGATGFGFSRTYANTWGLLRGSTDETTKSWENNIGKNWSHNYNMYCWVTSDGPPPTELVFFDADGFFHNFEYSTTASGKYIYTPQTAPVATPMRGVKVYLDSTTWDLEIHWPDGQRYGFWDDGDFFYLDYLENSGGARITMDYDFDGTDYHLSQVNAPSGDDRFLSFAYSGNLISSVSLEDTSGVLAEYNYSYTNGDLTLVELGTETEAEYTYGTDINVANSHFVTQTTDAKGLETNYSGWTYAQNPNANWVHCYNLTIDDAEGLTTQFDMTQYSVYRGMIVTEKDGSTALTKRHYQANDINARNELVEFFLTPTGTSKTTFVLTYDSTDIDVEEVWLGFRKLEEFDFTANGRILESGAPGHNGLTYDYATNALKPTKATTTDGLETFYYYDSATTDPRAKLTKVVAPQHGPDGIQYTYNGDGQILTQTDPLGNVTEYEYNTLGYLTKMTTPELGETTYTYDDWGHVVTVTDPENRTTTYEYDNTSGCGSCGGGQGLLVSITDPDSNETTMDYDANGNMIEMTDPMLRTTTYEYDDMNRLIKVTRPDSEFMTMTYSKLGQMTAQTDFSGKTTTYTYDYRGRVASVTDSVGTTSYTYTDLGSIKTVTDGNGHLTEYTYDSYERLILVEYADGAETHYTYDSVGRAIEVAAGTSGTVDPTVYTYDTGSSGSTGLLTGVSFTNGSVTQSVAYEYDEAGRMMRLNDWMGGQANDFSHYFHYNDEGRLEKYTDFDHTVQDPQELVYTYNAAGQIASVMPYKPTAGSAGDYTTAYTYTATGALDTITAPGSKVWNFDYNDAGQRTQYTHPNGMVTAYEYDTNGQLSRLLHKDGATVVEGWDYTLGKDGNILEMASAVSGSAQAWEYDYDGRGRLIGALYRNYDGDLTYSHAYTYDKGDNLLHKSRLVFEGGITDDFSDGNLSANPTWTTSSSNWSVVSGAAHNASSGIWEEIIQPLQNSDGEYRFSYRRSSGTGRVVFSPRYNAGTNDRITITFWSDHLNFKQVEGGVHTNFAADDYSVTTATGTWYDVLVRCEGAHISVYRAEQGGDFNLIGTTDAATVLSGPALTFQVQPGSEMDVDNVALRLAGDDKKSFSDDFGDGTYVGAWTVSYGTWVEANGYIRNDQVTTGYPNFKKFLDFKDFSVKFSVYREDSNASNFEFRDAANRRFLVSFESGQTRFRQHDGTTWTTPDTSTYVLTPGQWYNVQVVADGGHIVMWCGPQGGTPEKLLEVTQTLVEERTQMIFVSSPNSNVRYDNVAFNVPDPETTDFTYNDANELVTMNLDGVETHFTYDDWGRTASKYVGDGSVLHAEYGYRYGDKLKQVTSTFPGEEDEVHFIHDGLGKRRMKQVHADANPAMEREWYRYDAGWNVVGQYADDPGSFWDIGGLESTAIWHGMTPLAEVTGSTPNGAYRHGTHDHLGSTRSLFDASKNAVGAIEYTPYGLPLMTAGVTPEYSFTGKPFDAETGLYHFPYRQYSPVTARWLTRDPLGMVDGPNVYEYVMGNPINAFDYVGLKTNWPMLTLCMASCYAMYTAALASTSAACTAWEAACAALPEPLASQCWREQQSTCAIWGCINRNVLRLCKCLCYLFYADADPCDEEKCPPPEPC